MIKYLVLLISSFLFLSCQEEFEPKTLEIVFDHKAGNEDFEYGDLYENAAGNQFSLKLWRTYISEIQLVNAEGAITAFPNSFHLLEPLEGNSFVLRLEGVPQENYKEIRFNIGLRDDVNLSESSNGDLDPSNNMAWNWTTGYKFIRMDGEFNDASGNRRGVVVHVGTEANLKSQSFVFSDPLVVNESGGMIHFELNLLEAFQNPHIIDFEILSDFQFNNEADLIGENYAQGYIKLIE